MRDVIWGVTSLRGTKRSVGLLLTHDDEGQTAELLDELVTVGDERVAQTDDGRLVTTPERARAQRTAPVNRDIDTRLHAHNRRHKTVQIRAADY